MISYGIDFLHRKLAYDKTQSNGKSGLGRPGIAGLLPNGGFYCQMAVFDA